MIVGFIELGTGCKGGTASSGVDAAPVASVAAPASVSASAPPPAAGKPAGDVLHDHPDLLLTLPDAWEKRIAAYVAGNTDETSCPALKNVTATDEFERRDAVAKATAACTPENQKAVEYLKACPVLKSTAVEIGAYDFGRHVFPMTSSGKRGIVTKAGRVVREPGMLLSWPGVSKNQGGFAGVSPESVCHSHASVNDAVEVLTGMSLDLALPEDQAKKARDTMKAAGEDNGGGAEGWLDTAVLLDGGSAQEELACGVMTPKLATGRVLAWRLNVRGPTQVMDWKTASNWDPPPSCDEAKAFFNPPKASKPWDADLADVKKKFARGEEVEGEKTLAGWITWHDPTCICPGMMSKLNAFTSWAMDVEMATPDPDDDDAKRSQKLATLKGTVERGVKRFNEELLQEFEQPGCNADHGAKARMVPTIARAKKAVAALDDAVHKDPPNFAAIKSRSDALVKLSGINQADDGISDEIDPNNEGRQFGCPR